MKPCLQAHLTWAGRFVFPPCAQKCQQAPVKVITGVSVLRLCSQGGADPGKDRDGRALLLLQPLLLPCCTQEPWSWGTLKMPGGNSSITAMGPQGHAAEMLPSQELGPHFGGFSAQHLVPPMLQPSQRKVIYPSPGKAKSSRSSDASRPCIPTPPRAQSRGASPEARSCTSLCRSKSVTEMKSVPLALGFTFAA